MKSAFTIQKKFYEIDFAIRQKRYTFLVEVIKESFFDGEENLGHVIDVECEL